MKTIRMKFYFLQLSKILISAIMIGTAINSCSHMSENSPQNLQIESSVFHVKGVYWELPLAGVQNLSLDSNKLSVTGYCDSVNICSITKTIPPGLAVKNLYLDNHPDWYESDVVIQDSNFYKRTYFNRRSEARFSYKIPFNSFYRIQHVYHSKGDTTIIVFAFGKMKQDVHKWMGYIFITK